MSDWHCHSFWFVGRDTSMFLEKKTWLKLVQVGIRFNPDSDTEFFSAKLVNHLKPETFPEKK